MRFACILPLLMLVSSCAYYFEPEFNLTDEVSIYQVVDGDTFIVSGGEYVRLIGIDAPEKSQEGYHEAADFLRQFEGKAVMLEQEGADRDRYGRLLRHAFVGNQSLAVALLQNNHSVIYSYYNGTYYEEFLAAG
ncbi:thermonuclease family protein [Candidatus Woesearchaeota archaeon]|nr:thermonuclease family protein [Candidatus Woesearchaeota archaeon]